MNFENTIIPVHVCTSEVVALASYLNVPNEDPGHPDLELLAAAAVKSKTLSPATGTAVLMHLGGCPGCRLAVEEFLGLTTLVGSDRQGWMEATGAVFDLVSVYLSHKTQEN